MAIYNIALFHTARDSRHSINVTINPMCTFVWRQSLTDVVVGPLELHHTIVSKEKWREMKKLKFPFHDVKRKTFLAFQIN